MQEFLQMAAKQLGVSEQAAGSAAGGLLNLVKKNVDTNDFSSLLGKLPGASDLMGKAQQTAGTGGSGGLLGAATGLLGKLGVSGGIGQGLNVLSVLEGAGIGTDKAGSFVTMFVSFIKGKAGEQAIGSILGKLPELAKLLGK